MFAPSYSPYVSPYHRRDTPSPRERYVSALSRVRQAEMEYAAYLAQQDRIIQQRRQAEAEYAAYLAQQERIKAQQQRRNEQARVVAVKRAQMFGLQAALSSLLSRHNIRDEPQRQLPQAPVQRQVEKPTTAPDSGAQLQRRKHVRIVRPQESPVDASISAVRTALKRRLASEHNVEVHATIQNILSNLSSPASAPVVSRSTAAIQQVARAFRVLASEFAFPPQLDFTPSVSGSYHAAQLPYTPRNAPVRHYEHALNEFLAQLDTIDSEGDASVRRQRKFVVGLVEKALEDLDRIVEGRWKLQDTRAQRPVSESLASNLMSTAVNDDSAVTAPSPSVDHGEQRPSETQLSQTASIPEDGPRPATSVQEPLILSEEITEQEGASQAPIPSEEINRASNEESLRVSPSILTDASESETPSDSQTVDVPAVPVQETELPALVEPLARVPAGEESVTEVPAVDAISSPKSLSVVTLLPDEEPVLVDMEGKEDSDSASSWSEIED